MVCSSQLLLDQVCDAVPGPRSGLITPVSPAVFDPSSQSAPADRKSQKKPNPLTDLIETEKVYVDLLTGIIRVRRPLPYLFIVFE